MDKGDRYRLIIVISYVVLIICIVILLASLWNNLSVNPDVRTGNGIYLLVFLILILATVIFVLHIMEERQVLLPHEKDPEQDPGYADTKSEKPPDTIPAPFEVDIDLIASEIIPRIDLKESMEDYSEHILFNIARYFEIVQGIIYLKNKKTRAFESVCTYAYTYDKLPEPFMEGDGLTGQAAKNKKLLNLTSIPEGYIEVHSGLGKTSPGNLVIIPLLLNKETIGVIELASFHPMDQETEWTFSNLAKILSNTFVNKIKSLEKQ